MGGGWVKWPSSAIELLTRKESALFWILALASNPPCYFQRYFTLILEATALFHGRFDIDVESVFLGGDDHGWFDAI
jgi:hypothetical protein